MIEPFRIEVEESVLEDLRERLARTRFPDQIEGTGWEYGTPVPYLRELVRYWLDEYDWRAAEAKLNQLDHFTTEIDSQSIHFVHARAAADALPILVLHGWPGSIVEFQDVIPRLAEDFHVVAPSLPGYGFSEPTRTPGWDPTRMAQAFIDLMARLGYDRYGVQGGDWGSQVGTRIAVLDPDHCVALHLNMAIARRPKEDLALSPEDQADLAAMGAFSKDESAYSQVQGTRPHTLGAGLNDSPAGLLSWIVEKFRAWSDCDGDPENAFTRDQLLTNVMLYWVTETITSSTRLYWELQHGDGRSPYVTVPTGVARYPKEPIRFPRSWVERAYNVTHWAEMPRGGHFAALEQPDLFVDDVTTFFRTVC
ncbi:MAG: epoxide hydrolase family protein [Acidimicrobiales bacterium]